MAESFVQSEGVALVDMALRVSDTKSVPIIGTNVAFVKAEIIEVSFGISTATFVVETSTRDYVDNLLRDTMAGDTPRIRWRLGFGNPSGAVNWRGFQDYIIRSYGAYREGLGEQSGYFTKIVTSDQLWEIDRINRTTARQGKVSDIVQQIADFYKLQSVIEPTKTTGSYIQSFSSDYDFVRKRLVPRAVNDKGRGNYQFFVRDGALHFHTIDYQASLKDYSFYDSPGTKLVQIDKTQDLVEIGSAGVRTITYDPYTASTGELVSDPKNTLRLANTSPDIERLDGAKLNVMNTLGTNRVTDAQSITTSVYESAMAQMFQLQLTIPKTTFFRASDLVRMVIQPKSASTPPWNGLYYVTKTTSVVDKNSIMMTVDLFRGQFSTIGNSFTSLAQSGESVIQPQRAAEGQDPNLASVAASVITKGAGNATSRSRLLDTHNPNDPVQPTV